MTGERVAYVNGRIVPESEAVVSIRDRGFLSGDAVFDTTRTFGGRIFRLDEHLDRFFSSLKYMRIDPGLTKDDFARLTMEVLQANMPLLDDDDDYWVTQRVTRGVRVGGEDRPSIIIECVPLPFKARARYYRDGLPVIVPSVRRTPPESQSPRAKVHNYVNLVQAELEVKSQNPDAWPILLDTNGNLCRGARVQYLHRQGRRRHDPEGAVRPRWHQPPRDDRAGAGAGNRSPRDGHRPLRRLHRRRGVRHLDELLHLPGVFVQRVDRR